MEITSGADLALVSGEIETDPVTVDADGNILGYGTITGDETVNGTITAFGGTLELTGAIRGVGTLIIDESSTLLLEGSVDAGITIDFDSAGSGVLELADARDMHGVIQGQVAGDIISDLSCFLAGTRIATHTGERPVEHLAIGDSVLTATCVESRIRWMGFRHVTAARLADAHLHAPVCINKDAIAPGKPYRDLWLTPDHAIFVKGKLIPVKLLVNGGTIRQVPRASYGVYHIELERHDLLLAEGLEAESYLDVGAARQRFQNNPVVDLSEDYSLSELTEQAYAERGCYPITLAADIVQPVWEALASGSDAACDESATAWTSNPALGLRVANKLLAPIAVKGAMHVFALPPAPEEITICSRAALPWQRRPWIDDRRRLGVSVGRIRLNDGIHITDLPLDHPSLADGWHDVEREGARRWRWTNGGARLPLPAGTCIVEIHLAGSHEYPVEAAA